MKRENTQIMKHIFIIVLFIICSVCVSAQEKEYQELILSFSPLELLETDDPEFPDIIRVRKHLHRIINTDSVYRFFQADIFKPFKTLKVITNDHPIANDSVIKILRTDKYYILDELKRFYYIPDERNKIMPPDVLKKMIYAVTDSTTQYTQPIHNWDVSRMGERYIAETTMHRIVLSLHDYASKEDKAKIRWTRKTYDCCSTLYSIFMDSAVRLKISLPIFDEEYKYALFFFIEGQYDEHSFAIFERQNGEWNPIYVTRGKKSTLYSNDFKYYGGAYY